MINELLLIFSVVFIYGMAVLGYALFGKAGLYCISAVATILANIEALILVNAFSMEQTLGNVLFAVTFLITDILSECEGKKAANKAVLTGISVAPAEPPVALNIGCGVFELYPCSVLSLVNFNFNV